MAEAPITSQAPGSDLLPREISEFIFEDARQGSAVQQLARRVPLSLAGRAIPVMTGRPVAAWVAEGGRKPISDAEIGTVLVDPKKLAVIVPFSVELTRTDNVNLLAELRPEIAEAFAFAFDAAALHGTSTPFAAYIGETTNTVELPTAASVYLDLVAALGMVQGSTPGTKTGFRATGVALDDTAEVVFLGIVDDVGRPIFTTLEGAERPNRLVGRNVAYGEAVGDDLTIGFIGDWRQAVWGAVGEIEYDVSTQATLTKVGGATINLWQENLLALRAEAWYGFALRDEQAFASLTLPDPGP